MLISNRIMSDHLATLADVRIYGCDPMSFEDLREEFEVFRLVDELEGLFSI